MKKPAAPALPKVKVVLFADGNALVEDKPADARCLTKSLSHAEAHRIAGIYNTPETHLEGLELVKANAIVRAKVATKTHAEKLAEMRAAAIQAMADHNHDMKTDPAYRAAVKKEAKATKGDLANEMVLSTKVSKTTTLAEMEAADPMVFAQPAQPSKLDTFLNECHQVCFGKVAEITGLRKRSEETGLSLKSMRLVADAASVKIVKDGKELKVVPLI
jgi:hypothetical protein